MLRAARRRRHLQHSGLDAGHREDVIDLAAVKVGQTDGPDQAFLHQLFHRRPRYLVIDVVVQQGAVLRFWERDISLTVRWRKRSETNKLK